MKKLLTLLLAIVIALGLGVPAVANYTVEDCYSYDYIVADEESTAENDETSRTAWEWIRGTFIMIVGTPIALLLGIIGGVLLHAFALVTLVTGGGSLAWSTGHLLLLILIGGLPLGIFGAFAGLIHIAFGR